MWDLLPWKALPDSEAESDGRVEMATRCRTTCDDCERNANRIGKTDLENRAKGWFSIIQEEGGLGGDSWIPSKHMSVSSSFYLELLLTRRKTLRVPQQPSLSSISV